MVQWCSGLAVFRAKPIFYLGQFVCVFVCARPCTVCVYVPLISNAFVFPLRVSSQWGVRWRYNIHPDHSCRVNYIRHNITPDTRTQSTSHAGGLLLLGLGQARNTSLTHNTEDAGRGTPSKCVVHWENEELSTTKTRRCHHCYAVQKLRS